VEAAGCYWNCDAGRSPGETTIWNWTSTCALTAVAPAQRKRRKLIASRDARVHPTTRFYIRLRNTCGFFLQGRYKGLVEPQRPL